MWDFVKGKREEKRENLKLFFLAESVVSYFFSLEICFFLGRKHGRNRRFFFTFFFHKFPPQEDSIEVTEKEIMKIKQEIEQETRARYVNAFVCSLY